MDTPEQLTQEEIAQYSLDEYVPETEDNTENIEQASEEHSNNLDSNENSEDSDEQSSDDVVENNDEGVNYKFKPLKAVGTEIPIRDINELYTLASQGIDYTKKMQEIKPYRKMVSALQTENISEAELNILLDIRKGNIEAVKHLVKTHNIPVDMLTEDVQYVPSKYGKEEAEIQLAEVLNEIKVDTASYDVVMDKMKKLDDSFANLFFKQPEALKQFKQEVVSGTFDIVYPEAVKYAALDGNKKSLLDYYIAVEKNYYEYKNSQQQQEQSKQKAKQETIVNKKKQAVATGRSSVGSVNKNTVVDYMALSDSEYDKLYEQVMSRI